MIEKIKDFSSSMIQNVYQEIPGKSLKPFSNELYTDDDYVIITCSQLELFAKYMTSDKRLYVLLDQSIKPKQYINMKNMNIWFIHTELDLPNLVLDDHSIIHVPFNLIQNNNSIYNEIKKYLRYLIMFYVQKEKGFDYDFFEERSNIYVQYNDYKNLVSNKDFVISDTYDFENLIRNSVGIDSNKTYMQISSQYINKLDVIHNNLLNPVIINKDMFVELRIEFQFKFNEYAHKIISPYIKHEKAKGDQYFYIDGRPVIINDIEENKKVFKLDIFQRENEIYKDKLMKDFMDNNQPKSLCLKQKFQFEFEDYQLSDFSQIKLVSNETKERILGGVSIADQVDLYQSSKGLIVVTKEFSVELKSVKDVKYFLLQK